MYLFSGDADFMHALICATKLNKKIAILALENRVGGTDDKSTGQYRKQLLGNKNGGACQKN